MTKVETRAQLLAGLPRLTTESINTSYQQHHNIIEGNHAAAVAPSRLRSRKNSDFANYYSDRRSSLSACSTISSLTAYTPPPSPNRLSRLKYSIKRGKNNRIQPNRMSSIDSLATELTQMFQCAVQQCHDAEAEYKKLDNAMKAALDTQSKTYEDQITRLTQQIALLQRENNPKRRSVDFITELIHNYTGTNEEGQEDDELTLSQYESLLKSNERTMQTVVAQYVCDLEKERLENKRLKQIIEQQDRLISLLDNRRSVDSDPSTNSTQNSRDERFLSMNNNDKLLEVQLELQGIELEDTKRLLSNLIDERDGLLQQVDELRGASTPLMEQTICENSVVEENQQRDSVDSIDILAKIAQAATSYSPEVLRPEPTPLSLKHKYSFSRDPTEAQRSPPPKSPLPPTPTWQPQRPAFLSKSQSQRIQSTHAKQLDMQFRNSTHEHQGLTPSLPLEIDKDTDTAHASDSRHHKSKNIPLILAHSKHLRDETTPSNNKSHRHSLTLSSFIRSFKRHA